MSAIAAKLISSVILFTATVAVSIIPVMLLNYHKKKRQTIYIIRSSDTFNVSSSDTFNVSSIATQSSHTATTNLPKQQSDDNDSTRSNSIGSIPSISSGKLNKRSVAILQIFMFFSGGVLLATCFCHLIPEIKENFENYMISHPHIEPFSVEDSNEFFTDNYETTPAPGQLISTPLSRNQTDLPTTPIPLYGRVAS